MEESPSGSLRRLQGDRRKVLIEAASIRCRQFPTHDHGMSADEEIGRRHDGDREALVRCPPFPIPAVCLRAREGSRRRHIEYRHTPTAYPAGDSRRVRIPNTNLSQTYRIDGSAVTRHGVGDRLSRPLAKGGVKVERVVEHVGSRRIMARGSVHGVYPTSSSGAGGTCAWPPNMPFCSCVLPASASPAG